MDLKRIVQHSDTPAGRAFDIAGLILIFYSIITFSIETLPDLSLEAMTFLFYSEVVVTVLFTIEYLLRVFTSDKKTDYIFSFYGIIDLVAILPFYLSLGVDLRGLRAIRVFRVFRLLKLARYSSALSDFGLAIRLVKEEVILFLIATMILMYMTAVGIYYFENEAQPEVFKSVFHSLWWATATLTTVGYGDIYPITIGGKLFTFVILMAGLGIVAVPAGMVASALSKVRANADARSADKEAKEE